MSEAMKFKREIKAATGLDAQMLDTAEDGYVLTLERSLLDKTSYQLLAEFATQNQLNLQLEMGRYVISTKTLSPPRESRQVF